MEDKLILEGSSGVGHYGNICESAQMHYSYGVFHVKSCYINLIMELPSGKGFADAVYLPKRDIDRPALGVELK